MGKSKKYRIKSREKHKHKERKEKKKKLKKHKEKKKHREREKNNEGKEKTTRVQIAVITEVSKDEPNDDFSIPLELMNNKSHAPETPEEYHQRQNRLRREIDPVTGRSRLIKGDGEVLEEIVSKEHHKTINKVATKGDGDFFQHNALNKR